MTQRRDSRLSMLLDACVLIDFFKSDPSVLKKVVKQVGALYVASTNIDEVRDISSENDIVSLNIHIIDPELEDAYKAASGVFRAISFEDNIFLLTAKRHGFQCVTNDKKLFKICEIENGSCWWGLQLLIMLNECGGISKNEALKIVNKISITNPRYITEKILLDFANKLK